MTPFEIGKAYDQITHLWLGQDFNLNNGISQHQKALSFIKERGYALDLGCGCTGRFLDLLLKEGFKPEGLDISSQMLALAKVKHPQLTFHHADICEWLPQKNYHYISAWDSFWHIPLSEQTNVLSKIFNTLSMGGIFIFSFGGTQEAGERLDCYMGPQMYSATLGLNGYLSFFTNKNCLIRHMEFDQPSGDHAYLIVEKTPSNCS